jgi:Family of unknown function (DUF6090)
MKLVVSRRLLRDVREIAIVTIGIVIAFALNAWWEYHKDRRIEHSHLRALQSDFEQNVQRLEEQIAIEKRIEDSCRELLKIFGTSQARATQEVRPVVTQVFSSSRFDPVMGGYEGIVSSSGLVQLRDEHLRAELADFAASLSNRYGERISEDLYMSFIKRFMGRLRFSRPDSPDDGAYEGLLADPEFQEYVLLRGNTERDVGRTYQQWLTQSKDILERVRTELK